MGYVNMPIFIQLETELRFESKLISCQSLLFQHIN